jgi:hypothetical protein
MSERKLRLCIVTAAHSWGQFGGSECQMDCLIDVLLKTDRYKVSYLAAITSADSAEYRFRIVRIGNSNKSPRLGFLTHARPLLHFASSHRFNLRLSINAWAAGILCSRPTMHRNPVRG